MPLIDPDLALDVRSGLPDALRILLEEYPRDGWEADPGFEGLIRFWLDRHLMFRKMIAMLTQEAEGRIDGRVDPNRYAQNLARLGGRFVNDLHGHHMIEDHHYFPALATKDARIETGFELLDADHHAIDPMLQQFADGANSILRAEGPAKGRDATGAFLADLRRMDRLLDRHLTDEEELIVPVILKYGSEGVG